MNYAMYAFIGGLLSLVATSCGAFILLYSSKANKFRKLQLSFDFSVGLIISASVFLIGPEFVNLDWKSEQGHMHLLVILLGLFSGALLILLLQRWTEWKTQGAAHAGKILLGASLVIHNFPEGMGSGAAMIGMSSVQLFSVQTGLVLQNIIEGFLVAATLSAVGFSVFRSILGGVFSGVVEFLGALVAGFAIQQAMIFLPFSLCFAGSAMLTAVLHEVDFRSLIKSKHQLGQAALGFSLLPVLNVLISMF